MLQVYCGGDVEVVRKAARTAIASYESIGHEMYRLDAEQYVTGALRDAIDAQSLFGVSPVYLLDTPSSHTDFHEEFMELCEQVAGSTVPFVVIEGILRAPELKKLRAVGEVFDQGKAPAVNSFNTFALADAVLRKNKKALWVAWSDAVHAGVGAEEMIGILWWQLKTLQVVRYAPSPEAAGIKPYPYKKAQHALAYFTEDEIQERMHSLSRVYHMGHAGEVNIMRALEQWVLT
jgi:hypothetical protein